MQQNLKGYKGHGKSPQERLMLQSVRNETTGCRTMTKVPTSDGYCQLRINGKLVTCHRYAFELAGGTIPEGYQLDHKCCNRRCIEPSHLEAVTSSQNVQRSYDRGRQGNRRILTQLQADEIRARYAAGGITLASLAFKYGISPTHACGIVNFRSWVERSHESVSI